MKSRLASTGAFLSVLFLSVGFVLTAMPTQVQAKESSITVTGSLYEFEKGSKYEVDSSESTSSISRGSSYGTFSISGSASSASKVNGFTAYEVSDGNIEFNYTLGSVYDTDDTTRWHREDDKSKTVNGEKLDEDILSGAVILQSSFDGENWVTDSYYTDIADVESEFQSDFYTTKDIQQVNGCYYRVIIAYELRKQVEDKKYLFVSVDNYEYKKCAEVYEFYIINDSENRGTTSTAATEPRMELGKKVKTDKDSGYSGTKSITNDDPHYGWDLGTFTINGYTRETTYNGDDIYLKNVGDKVTLWFTFEQDINCLNGDSNLVINNDSKAWDEEFEIPETYFKHGTLIIQYTDYEGNTHDPVIYTDFLAANAHTGADTKVELFEEGNYEVALDYEIKDKKGIDSVTDYRIRFSFQIRNGNCMVYPFDIVSGTELSDGSLTENGFKLDMAKSRYLNIDVKKIAIKDTDGVYSEDTRFNRPAKDGESYADEGMYVFTVSNLYTGDTTTKTIYVGTSPIIRAMASTRKSADEINELIADGAVILDDGTITFPASNEVVETVEETEEEEETEIVEEEAVESSESADISADVSPTEETSTSNTVLDSKIIGILAAIVVIIIVAVMGANSKKKSKKKAELQKAAAEKTLAENDATKNDDPNESEEEEK